MEIIKTVVTFAVGFIIGALGMYYFLNVDTVAYVGFTNEGGVNMSSAQQASREKDRIKPFPSAESGSVSEVIVQDQLAGSSVVVGRVFIPEDGWVVVHEVINGHISNALGATRVDAGEYTNVHINLLRSTEAKSAYVVVLYADNGDKQFELSADLPIVDALGEAYIQTFNTI